MASTTNQPAKTAPKDAQVIQSIFEDMGITEYEPQVVTQLLEFIYKYVTTTLEDAKVYSQHAGKKTMDVEDVQLAVQMQLDKNFTTPPPRDLLLEVARAKNTVPLPQIKPHCGIRLPPDRYCMTACNFELKSTKKPPPGQKTIFTTTAKVNPAIKRTVLKGQTIPLSSPKPVIKFTPSTSASSGVVVQTIMDVDEPPVSFIKRKHPDED